MRFAGGNGDVFFGFKEDDRMTFAGEGPRGRVGFAAVILGFARIEGRKTELGQHHLLSE